MEKDFDRSASHRAMNENAASLRGRSNKYYEWNLRQFPIRPHSRILDLGCGPGLYFPALMDYDPAVYVGVDFSRDYLNELEALAGGRSNCRTVQLDILAPGAWRAFNGQKFDHIFCFDVLEHLPDDLAALIAVRRIMTHTGTGLLFLKVPALMSIYGSNDRAIGHFRRYSRDSLTRILQQADLEVLSVRYHNLPGIAPWFFIGRIMKRTLAASEKESRLFNRIAPLIEAVERLIPPPIGLSLCAVCTLKQTAGQLNRERQ